MTPATQVAAVPLSDGTEIPQLGFGTWQIAREDTVAAVGRALEVGYRHVDTAAAYGNEREVGEAVRRCGDHVYVTTKLWNSDQGRRSARSAFKKSLKRLGLDHVDLYLIHWPLAVKDEYLETWETLIELRASDALRSIGVSNFQPGHLERIIEATGVTPVINQIELHPYLQQADLRAMHAERGIVTEAWSPLGQGGELLADAVLEDIARARGRTVAQVVLRWHLQLGNVIFPKSSNPERIAENFDILGFELTEEDMRRIARLDRGERVGPDPDTFAVGA